MRPKKIGPLDVEARGPRFVAADLGYPPTAWVKMVAESECPNPLDARNVEMIVNFGLAIVKTAGGNLADS
jgi:hypothetical protein